MALYTIADLHLACGVAKPMDVFGGRWEGYMDKIAQHWRECIGEDDTVVIGGDFSWGLNLAQSWNACRGASCCSRATMTSGGRRLRK